MPWLCLERCGDNSADISMQLKQFAVNSSVLNAAAFELFNLGPNSTLVVNNLTQVAGTLHGDGIPTFAMVSSYPYPPDFLLWMRQVFANPAPFIDACITAAKQYSLTGFNIDWEPTDGNGAPKPTKQDAADYVTFLDTFSKAMHGAGLKATVCVATWSEIWDIPAIAATEIDLIMDMETYTEDWTTWQTELADELATIPAAKLVVGLETVKDSNGQPYSTAELAQRFGALKAAGVRSIGVWRSGIPGNWWPFLLAL